MTAEIGVVAKVEKTAFGTPPEQAKRLLGAKDDVFSDELVETAEKGALHIRFLDDSELRLGSSAQVSLDRFVYDPGSSTGELIVEIQSGVLRLITGSMEPAGIKIVTPTAVIGIRGSDVIIKILLAGAVVVAVLKGQAIITSIAGEAVETIIDRLETAAIDVGGLVTLGVPTPEADFGLGGDVAALLAAFRVNGDQDEPGTDFDLPGDFNSLGEDPELGLDALSQDFRQVNTTLDFQPVLFALVFVLLLVIAESSDQDAGAFLEALIEILLDEASASESASVIRGTAGDDTLTGGTGDQTIYGEAGDDLLNAGDGKDVLYGGLGDDELNGEAGDDLLFGDAGDDLLSGGDGGDTMFGGGDADTLYGGAGMDSLLGGDGADTLYGGDAPDSIAGSAGSDTLYGGADGDSISGGTGDDLAYGDDGSDSLSGGAGDDRLYGGGSADKIDGDDGMDEIEGGAGDDLLYGGDGADDLNGGAGNDDLYGGADDDTLYGDTGDDDLIGGDGDDLMDGSAGDDDLDGGLGNDVLYGFSGKDDLDGGSGADTLYGEDDSDTLYGLDGDDTIYGGDGTDTLFGEVGADSLTGGNDADVFAVLQGDGGGSLALADVITDFQDGADLIGLAGGLTFAAVTVIDQGTGNDAIVQVTASLEFLAVIQGLGGGFIGAADFVVLP